MKNQEKLIVAAQQIDIRYRENGPLPHLQFFVSVNGEPLIDQCFGSANEYGDPLTPDAIYRIASMTKPIAVAAFLVLVQQGQVALDTLLADILPEFAQMNLWTGAVDGNGTPVSAPCDSPITMLDLLRHSAGFSYSFHNQTPIDRLYLEHQLDNFHQRRAGEEYARTLADIPLQLKPGTRFHYSVATDLLGAVIERVSGAPLDRFLTDIIFEPLGMGDSFFVIPDSKKHRLTDAWMWDGKDAPSLYDRGEQSRWRIEQKFYSAGGGLLSTVRDYHRFLLMLMGGGMVEGKRILSADNVALMMRNHLLHGGDLVHEQAAPVSETSQPGIGMGLGGGVIADPSRALAPGSAGTYFWGGILSTGFFLDPMRNITGIVMTQLMPSGLTQLREDFRRAVYEALDDTIDRPAGKKSE